MRIALLLTLGVMSAPWAIGQSFTINGGDATTCVGALFDSGGEGATGYQNNENFTMTICPDGSTGNSISLDFAIFSLSTEGTEPLDQLTIYDGANTSAPLIGTYTGQTTPGIVTASFGNTSGCLTLNFTSNEVGAGLFAAFITCYTPCQPPVAIATMEGLTVPALVCQNEVIEFDGSASTVAPGASIAEYKWIFDDGTVDSLSGPLVSHSFPFPGEYVVQLELTDNSVVECQSTNNVDLQILVSTTPDFTATSLLDTTVCQGATFILNATGVTGTEWSAIPDVDFGEGIYLPDDQTQPFVSEIQFNGFAPGATLTTVDDLVSICVSMEHSYMGDLVISIICPNGQQAILHQQGGGATYIGDALDGEETPPVAGTCLDYCWTPNAPNGTFVDCAAFGATPNVQPATVTPGGNVLIPGDYTSIEPLSQLEGCPLNGTWTFRVADLFGIDDGFICSWQLTFDGSLYPDLTSYTPDLGLSTTDSASWSGPGVVTDPQNPLVAIATPTQAGVFDYIFSVTDNFGCTYDTAITVTVDPAPQGPIFITGDDVVCDGGVAYLNAPAGYTTYEWSNGFFGPNISVGPGTYTVSVSLGGCPLQSEPFTVGAAESPDPVIDGPISSCGGQPATLTTTEEYVSYLWSNSSTDPSITVGTGSYTVTVTNAEGCSATSTPFPVTVGSNPQAAFTTNPPSPQGIGATVLFDGSSSQGNGSPIDTWSWQFGVVGEGSSDPSPSYTFTTPGTYNVTLTITTEDDCESVVTIPYVILPEDIEIPNVFTPNNDGNNDYFVIENGEYYRNSLAVYNRWGQLVFEANNYRNTWRAADVPDGTYYYVFTTEDNNKEYTGHLTILR